MSAPVKVVAGPNYSAAASVCASHAHDTLSTAEALLRVVVSALDAKDDVEDEAHVIGQAVERIQVVRKMLDGAQLQRAPRSNASTEVPS